LGALKRNKTLDRVAKRYARYLARTGKFSHTADGRQPAERARAGGYAYCQFAENLALNGDSRGFRARQLARKAVTGWKNSPGHRRNMLQPHVTEIGVGVARKKAAANARAAARNTYISVQLFGRPEAMTFEFAVTNRAGRDVRYVFAEETFELPVRAQVTHTVCRPGVLTFPAIAKRSDDARSDFAVERGDRFVVSTTPSGRIAVRHQPATN
ncbi:MAG: CAP domain-containing protein, partial [Pseudomonadota bacterium]